MGTTRLPTVHVTLPLGSHVQRVGIHPLDLPTPSEHTHIPEGTWDQTYPPPPWRDLATEIPPPENPPLGLELLMDDFMQGTGVWRLIAVFPRYRLVCEIVGVPHVGSKWHRVPRAQWKTSERIHGIRE